MLSNANSDTSFPLSNSTGKKSQRKVDPRYHATKRTAKSLTTGHVKYIIDPVIPLYDAMRKAQQAYYDASEINAGEEDRANAIYSAAEDAFHLTEAETTEGIHLQIARTRRALEAGFWMEPEKFFSPIERAINRLQAKETFGSGVWVHLEVLRMDLEELKEEHELQVSADSSTVTTKRPAKSDSLASADPAVSLWKEFKQLDDSAICFEDPQWPRYLEAKEQLLTTPARSAEGLGYLITRLYEMLDLDTKLASSEEEHLIKNIYQSYKDINAK